MTDIPHRCITGSDLLLIDIRELTLEVTVAFFAKVLSTHMHINPQHYHTEQCKRSHPMLSAGSIHTGCSLSKVTLPQWLQKLAMMYEFSYVMLEVGE